MDSLKTKEEIYEVRERAFNRRTILYVVLSGIVVIALMFSIEKYIKFLEVVWVVSLFLAMIRIDQSVRKLYPLPPDI